MDNEELQKDIINYLFLGFDKQSTIKILQRKYDIDANFLRLEVKSIIRNLRDEYPNFELGIGYRESPSPIHILVGIVFLLVGGGVTYWTLTDESVPRIIVAWGMIIAGVIELLRGLLGLFKVELIKYSTVGFLKSTWYGIFLLITLINLILILFNNDVESNIEIKNSEVEILTLLVSFISWIIILTISGEPLYLKITAYSEEKLNTFIVFGLITIIFLGIVLYKN